jgi:hypothetical protein
VRLLGRWGCTAALLACLGLPGCCCRTANLRGENFADDGLASQARSMRKPDGNTQPWAITNRGRQIEKDVGYQ